MIGSTIPIQRRASSRKECTVRRRWSIRTAFHGAIATGRESSSRARCCTNCTLARSRPQGTWAAAIEKLPHLRDLGVTLIEVMPVAAFPGKFGWGYDGTYWFAPTQLYGGPDDFRAFVNHAHRLGIGVILDVVYNHFGPCGNYTAAFSPYYGSSKHSTEWGDAINFDGEHCGPVRDFVAENAAHWIREYHLDGLRLDAMQSIDDDSAEHIVTKLTCAARAPRGTDRSSSSPRMNGKRCGS